ncbi:MAG TPA: ROK family protein [Anaeromyxobacteraceae bacterium]|nr:ROK family protein [Anaeromyxobacteraceae bacterium]
MASLALGIDLGGTNARAALVDRATGEVVALERRALARRSPEEVVEVLRRAVLAVAGERPASLGRIGVGVAGQVMGGTGLVFNAPNLGWRDVPLGNLLAGALGAPVRVVNDLSAAAWGETCFGAARGARDVLVVFAGTGVGSGIVVGGRLHEGACGVAGELGHVKVRPPRAGEPPRRCGCGSVGCLEAYVGGANLAVRVRAEVEAGVTTRIVEFTSGDISRVTASQVEQACQAGDAYARQLWEELGELLGTAVANAVTLLNPERLVLGGGVLRASPTLRERVGFHVAAATSRTAAARLAVVDAERGDEAGVIGAALLGSESGT